MIVPDLLFLGLTGSYMLSINIQLGFAIALLSCQNMVPIRLFSYSGINWKILATSIVPLDILFEDYLPVECLQYCDRQGQYNTKLVPDFKDNDRGCILYL